MIFEPREDDRWLLSCEHGGNGVPPEWQGLFRGAAPVLDSHRGWDRGALAVWSRLKDEGFDAAFHGTVTRLLVDLNRSPTNPAVFSDWTRPLARDRRETLLATYHRPYRQAVEGRVAAFLASGCRVIHVAVHTFTPVLDGQLRTVDVGLLYDPSRPVEKALARRWGRDISALDSALRVRMNAPYRGRSDGLPTSLRSRFGPDYLGIELELNQALFEDRGEDPVSELIARSLRDLRGRGRTGTPRPGSRPGIPGARSR